MGGNALSVKTRRYQRDEYFAVESEVMNSFVRQTGVLSYMVLAYESKESYGDLDLVIDASVDRKLVEHYIINHLKSKELVKNSNVWSFEYKEFQIDFVFSPNPHWTSTWMDYNDCSNLVGRVAHKFGLKFGQTGMFLPVRDGDQKLGEILVSTDFYKCLDFLGFESCTHAEGFGTLECIYDFIARSEFFNPEIYLLDNRNAKARMRDAKRPTYTGFLKYCETLPEKEYFQFDSDKSAYLETIFMSFPGVKLEYDKLMAKHTADKVRKEKFNGELVRSWTGLEGKELGVFMASLREKQWFLNLVDEAPVSAICAAVVQLWGVR